MVLCCLVMGLFSQQTALQFTWKRTEGLSILQTMRLLCHLNMELYCCVNRLQHSYKNTHSRRVPPLNCSALCFGDTTWRMLGCFLFWNNHLVWNHSSSIQCEYTSVLMVSSTAQLYYYKSFWLSMAGLLLTSCVKCKPSQIKLNSIWNPFCDNGIREDVSDKFW